MTAVLDHVAVNSNNIEATVQFFTDVFHMTISREVGIKPHRQVWFHQGIQINETIDPCDENTMYHHIALRVSDKSNVVASAKTYGGSLVEGKNDWIMTRDGIVIEILV